MLLRSVHRVCSRHFARQGRRHLRRCHQRDVRRLGAGSDRESARSLRLSRAAGSPVCQPVAENPPCLDATVLIPGRAELPDASPGPPGASLGRPDAGLNRLAVSDVAFQAAAGSDGPRSTGGPAAAGSACPKD